MLAAFEAYKAVNDERVAGLEARRGDVLLEKKTARIDAGLFGEGRCVLRDGLRPPQDDKLCCC
ncbi:MAG: hypothetical protein ABW063_03055 [Caulobacter sp.]